LVSEAVAILLGGPPGSGKSAVKRLAPRFFRPRLGEIAAIEMDEIYTLIDPDWTGANSRWGEITSANCVLLARSFLGHGFRAVLISSNGFYHKELVNRFLTALLPISRVHHFTLDVQVDVAVRRVRERGDLDRHEPDWVPSWIEMVRSHRANWTHVIDTTELSPEGVLEAIYERIVSGEGAISRLIE
jgi:hypothetical protein